MANLRWHRLARGSAELYCSDDAFVSSMLLVGGLVGLLIQLWLGVPINLPVRRNAVLMNSATSRNNTSIVPQVSRVPRRWILVVGATAGLMIAFGPRMSTELREPTHVTPVLNSVDTPMRVNLRDAACWVPGDMIGDGNPAAVAAALCGQ